MCSPRRLEILTVGSDRGISDGDRPTLSDLRAIPLRDDGDRFFRNLGRRVFDLQSGDGRALRSLDGYRKFCHVHLVACIRLARSLLVRRLVDVDVERYDVVFANARFRLAGLTVTERWRNRHEQFGADLMACQPFRPPFDDSAELCHERGASFEGRIERLTFAPHLADIVGDNEILLGDRRSLPFLKDGHGQIFRSITLRKLDDRHFSLDVQRKGILISGSGSLTARSGTLIARMRAGR